MKEKVSNCHGAETYNSMKYRSFKWAPHCKECGEPCILVDAKTEVAPKEKNIAFFCTDINCPDKKGGECKDEPRAMFLIEMEIIRQESIIPASECYPANRNGVRLALAAMQDELDETHEAWHLEKKAHEVSFAGRPSEKEFNGWKKTKEELVQAIAVGIRLLKQLP